MSIEIEGTPIPTPQTFEVLTSDIVRQDRTASGLEVTDIIATKKVFRFGYSSLTGSELAALRTLLYTNYYFDLTYPTENGSDTTEVGRGDIDGRLLRNAVGDKQYININFELRER
jgi:hypothetical protein